MPRFLPPRIRQCFAAAWLTIIMHYAVSTAIIYVNIKVFKRNTRLRLRLEKVLGETVTDRVIAAQFPVPFPFLTF